MRYSGDLSMKKLLNEYIESDKFELGKAGYIKEDGTFIFMEEYHGEDHSLYQFNYPEFSNTHPEEDTCVRLSNEPNEIQYKKLEEIIDLYLDNEEYCKIEIWRKGKYNFYKVFSLREGACEDYTWNEKVGNWTGYKLVNIIKNYFHHLENISDYIEDLEESKQLNEQLLLELNRGQLINKSKASDNYKDTSKGRNRWERRNKSKITTRVDQYNKIDMNSFFKNDELKVGINVHGETSDYIVAIRYNGVLKEIAEQIKRNNNKLEFKCILIALQRVFNQGNVFVSCTCLHPDTKIKLLDGSEATGEELKKRFDLGEKLYVYSTDEKGDFKPGEIENVFITKTTSDFIKITLDNNQDILTTPDHQYMLRDGTYKKAEDLCEGDSLMSIYFSSSNGYETLNKGINEAVTYFKLNHKVFKIEKITLDPTPVYDITVKDWHNFLVSAGVVLHNCADWKYRQAYHATRGGYNSGTPEIRASDITNPRDSKGAGCKHVNLVLGNIDWIMKIASVINNYIHYMEDHFERKYADLIFPKLYGMPYQKAIQLNLFDTDDNLSDDEDEIKLSNRYGRERTKFRSDRQVNNMRNFNKQNLINNMNKPTLDLNMNKVKDEIKTNIKTNNISQEEQNKKED